MFLLLSAAGCSLIWGPTATAKNFMSAAQKGDADAMTKLFSSKGIQAMGLDRIKTNNQQFAEMCKKSAAASGPYSFDDIKEIIKGDTARVSGIYHNKDHADSIKLVFDLSKEGGSWKIDDIGGADKEDQENFGVRPSPSPSVETATPTSAPGSSPATEFVPPIPPPPKPASSTATADKGEVKTETPVAVSHAPISGGVLNSKAISLPKPPYPPVARAAQASGTVNVQVTVDEKGNVTSASAVSGHPLLRAAAIAAARQARFAPTKLSGTPVKVTGIIVYNFVP
ncbi:MAG TPA: TonB family protein [Pyrinomonadaceae bacterium]|nr:TonB family protein [Pyrinomonadaceae bacterium]